METGTSVFFFSVKKRRVKKNGYLLLFCIKMKNLLLKTVIIVNRY
jgi:hypothetical protein